MKAIVKFVIAIVLVLITVVVVVGLGRVVAGTEYPFGVGPWSTTGRYCRDVYSMTQFVDRWKRAGQPTPSPTQKETWLAFEKTLTSTGPQVPRADFTAWYRRTGDVSKRMTSESALINEWWNQNCTSVLMEASASANSVWSGVDSHETFVHYPRNVIHLEGIFEFIR